MYEKQGLEEILQKYLDKNILPELEKNLEEGEKIGDDIIELFKKNIPDDLLEELGGYFEWAFNDNDIEEYGFGKRLRLRWQQPIFLLKSSIELSFQLIKNQKECLDEEKNHSLKSMLLIRLHGKAVLISREILLLINNGYGEGANSRWRSLYENCVIIIFLSQQDDSVIERYINHDHVRQYNHVLKHITCSVKLGHETYTNEDVEKYKKLSEEAIEKYGKEFKSQYGWIPKGFFDKKKKGPIRFEDIEKDVGLSHFSVYHNHSNESIHAGIKSLENIGLQDQYSLIMTGPSNYGLADPIQNTDIILTKLTASVYICLSKKINKLEHTIPGALLFYIYSFITKDIGNIAVGIQKDIKRESDSQKENY